MGNASWGNGHHAGISEGLRIGRLQGGLVGVVVGAVLARCIRPFVRSRNEESQDAIRDDQQKDDAPGNLG